MQGGLTSLILAADQEDSTDIVAALIEAKADPNIQDRVCVIVAGTVISPYFTMQLGYIYIIYMRHSIEYIIVVCTILAIIAVFL